MIKSLGTSKAFLWILAFCCGCFVFFLYPAHIARMPQAALKPLAPRQQHTQTENKTPQNECFFPEKKKGKEIMQLMLSTTTGAGIIKESN